MEGLFILWKYIQLCEICGMIQLHPCMDFQHILLRYGGKGSGKGAKGKGGKGKTGQQSRY